MKKILLTVIAASLLQGCLYNHRMMPPDVAHLPNDCANQSRIENWLGSQIDQSKGMLMTEKAYVQGQKTLKRKIWDLRYHCNR